MFDKNKSLSSGVILDSRIELRAGSKKCRALCNRVRMNRLRPRVNALGLRQRYVGLGLDVSSSSDS